MMMIIIVVIVVQFNSIYFADYQEDKHTKTIHLPDIHTQKVLIHEYIHLFIHIPARPLLLSLLLLFLYLHASQYLLLITYNK